MTSSPLDDHVHSYLDETITADALAELEHWIRSDPQNAESFARMILLHDRLRAELQTGEFLRNQAAAALNSTPPSSRDLSSTTIHSAPAPRRSPGRSLLVTAAVTIASLMLIVIWQSSATPVVEASDELKRIIQFSQVSADRTYSVTAVEQDIADDPPSRGARRSAPPIDGAVLHVRGANQYVLIRYFADGSRTVTGSNGTSAWSVPPEGRVRVSRDVNRFRGAVPGQQHAIPFIDLRSSLQELSNSYELVVSPETDVNGYRRLTAIRKVSVAGGPKQVTIWYVPKSGQIVLMLLERLPQRRGGPGTVVLELTDERDLGPDFFEHSTHHSSNREVIEE